jgi:hypothetical protein
MFTTPSPEPDASLRRIRRDAAIICVATAVLALLLLGGRPAGALGVLAGGALMAVSYAAIRGTVDASLRRSAASLDQAQAASRAAAWAAFRFIARYGAIAVLAWAVLVPLRVHPLGVFAGITAPVLAVGIEAIRLARRSNESRTRQR